MIPSSEGRSSGVLSILQDSVFPSAVASRSLFRFGDGRDCVEDELEDLWFRLDIGQLFYAPNIIFKTLNSSQTSKNYGAEKTPPSAILLVPVPQNSIDTTCIVLRVSKINKGDESRNFANYSPHLSRVKAQFKPHGKKTATREQQANSYRPASKQEPAPVPIRFLMEYV